MSSDIEVVIDRMDYLIVILSPASVDSRWVTEEVRLALHKGIAGRNFNVIPILKEDCDVPGFLRDRKYVDMRPEADYQAGQRWTPLFGRRWWSGCWPQFQTPEVALRVRIATGDVLGHVGYPRLGELVSILAGGFLMGNDEDDRAKPQHEVVLSDYQIGKY